MPLTSETTCHNNAPRIGHNVSLRCHSHQTQRDTDLPSHRSRSQRYPEMPLTSDTTRHRDDSHIGHN
ncbi:hypothetical protein DPMN_108087 [Dreissena polymorpha]|uniref:Uncharacterized protein n=1 Tax=Dreissena polymorpha TaxID=45954 RepID=A0A9D4QLN7_DREPO|nr:hypothetical protein DPMN_108087 [Dreissena polymorpha]